MDRRPSMAYWVITCLVLVTIQACRAYIPALPTNSTPRGGSGYSMIVQLTGDPFTMAGNSTTFDPNSADFDTPGTWNGSSTALPALLYASNVSGLSVVDSNPVQGPLYLWTDANNSYPPKPYFWTAFISCDTGNTTAPEGSTTANGGAPPADAFKLANDANASLVLLYSEYSSYCSLTTQYRQQYGSSTPLSIFTMSSQQVTQAILKALQNATNLVKAGQSVLQSSIGLTYLQPDLLPILPGDPLGYETARNATASASVTSVIMTTTVMTAPAGSTAVILTPTTSSATSTGGLANSFQTPTAAVPQSTSSGTTGVAMIVLYAITGTVTLLFVTILLSGAIRAARHPERYGPRAAVPGQGPNGAGGRGGQTRAIGLAKAVLDTFPIVKFGAGSTGAEGEAGTDAEAVRVEKDEEEGRKGRLGGPGAEKMETIEMKDLVKSPNADELDRQPLVTAGEQSGAPVGSPDATTKELREAEAPEEIALLAVSALPGTLSTHQVTAREPALPNSRTITTPSGDVIDNQWTCPICVSDFEAGEDLRLLPCRHVYHATCVDPWLLVNSHCPLCRADLNLPGGGSGPMTTTTAAVGASTNAETEPGDSRWSRVLELAKLQKWNLRRPHARRQSSDSAATTVTAATASRTQDDQTDRGSTITLTAGTGASNDSPGSRLPATTSPHLGLFRGRSLSRHRSASEERTRVPSPAGLPTAASTGATLPSSSSGGVGPTVAADSTRRELDRSPAGPYPRFLH